MGKFNTAKQFINQIFGGAQKTTGTEVISSITPNVPVTKLDKAKSKLAIAKQKTKASQAKLDNTIFRINQQKKRLETGPGSANPRRPGKMSGGRIGLKGGSDLGMQSVKYGLDNNPKITAADPKAKFIAANKKKKKKFESPMAKAIKKKNKKRII